ncbi:MAG: cupin domain-containing protein [Ktedonobacteraceae bacterium]|nr:cupin domain-containing protein [Ktedonobacteraceae bacterium]MBV9711837.1 cupin domain-containing protein [Ktedonobacteraceae bacterium]
MQIRRFSTDLKTKISGNHPGLYGVPIQMNSALIPPEKREEFTRRVKGMPLFLDADLQVEAMYFEPHARMEEHATDHPILFLALLGRGMVRIGGLQGETRDIQAGEAVLWPAHTKHTVWTDDEVLHAIVINAPQEKA